MTDMKNPIGEQIDDLYAMRDERIAKQREVDKLKKEENDLVKDIMITLEKMKLPSASGTLATFSTSETTVPKVVDFDKLSEYIMKSGHIHLLGRTVSAPAYRELYELEGNIPGVEPYIFSKHSLTRSKK